MIYTKVILCPICNSDGSQVISQWERLSRCPFLIGFKRLLWAMFLFIFPHRFFFPPKMGTETVFILFFMTIIIPDNILKTSWKFRNFIFQFSITGLCLNCGSGICTQKQSTKWLKSSKPQMRSSPQFLWYMHHHNRTLVQHSNMKQLEDLQGTCEED